MPKISVIVPVYNVEKYLDKCVMSIINQTFTDLEIILVDDGSPDNCGKMCDGYAKEDSRIKVIHSENGGVSVARNTGIEAATGEFLAFSDSDDFMEPTLMETLYKMIENDGSDLACCGIADCYKGENEKREFVPDVFCVSAEEAYRLLMEGKKITGSPCAKLFRAQTLSDIRFVPNRIYEDAIMFSELFCKISKVSVSTEELYTYFHRENSYTTTFKSNDTDAIFAYETNLEVVKAHFPNLLSQGWFRLYWAYFITLDKMLQTENYKSLPTYKSTVSFLKKNAFKIASNKCFGKGRRLSALLLFVNTGLYKAVSLANTKKNLSLNG